MPAEQRNVFGYFGNLNPWKGVPVLLEACKRLIDEGVDFELRVHGGAPFQSEDFVARIERLFDGDAVARRPGSAPTSATSCRS